MSSTDEKQVNKYSGVITEKKERKSGTTKDGKDWVNQEFLIRTADQYPRTILFLAKGKVLDYLDKHNEGDTVEVCYNLESKEFKGVIYQNAVAWSIK